MNLLEDGQRSGNRGSNQPAILCIGLRAAESTLRRRQTTQMSERYHFRRTGARRGVLRGCPMEPHAGAGNVNKAAAQSIDAPEKGNERLGDSMKNLLDRIKKRVVIWAALHVPAAVLYRVAFRLFGFAEF